MIFNKKEKIICPKCGSSNIINMFYPISTLEEINSKKLLPLHKCKKCNEEFDFKEQGDIYKSYTEELAFNYTRRSI